MLVGNDKYIIAVYYQKIPDADLLYHFSERVFLHCNSLKQVYFEGDAPSCEYLYDEAYQVDFLSFLPEYTIYYHEGAEGFTSLEWNGYKTQIWWK